jgi:hypothetical protein
MLDENKIYQNKLNYLQLLNKLNVDLTELYKYLDAVDYFNKPASHQYFKAYAGGLCQYALDLYFELCQLVNAYFPGKYTEVDVIKVALFRDLYRAELYESYLKSVKNDSTGAWDQVPAFKYSEHRSTFGDLNFNSYMIAKRYIDFTDEQIEAILQSNARSDYAGDIHTIMRDYPLVTLTKMADLATTYLGEN